MASLGPLKDTKDLKMFLMHDLFAGRVRPTLVDYDSPTDSLMILAADPNTSTVVHFIDDQIALLFDAENDSVVGIRVDGFEKKFLKHHRNVRRVWAEKSELFVAREIVKVAEDVLGGADKLFQRVTV